MFKIVLCYPGYPDRVISASEATKEQIRDWINQAPDNSNRQIRKQMMHAYMYGAGPTDLLKLAKVSR